MPNSTTNSKASAKTGANFAQHAQQDEALRTSPDSSSQGPPLSLLGKALIFLLFPLLVGLGGLFVGYMESIGENPKREMNFENDFMFPFALALALGTVIGFQTRGFSTTQPAPLVPWPKVKKEKKIVHKYIVKGQSVTSDKDKTQ